MILVSKWELNFLHCWNSEGTLSYFDKNSLSFSERLFRIDIIDKSWVDICKFLNELFFTHIFMLNSVKNHIQINICKSKNTLKINLKMEEAWNGSYLTTFIGSAFESIPWKTAS